MYTRTIRLALLACLSAAAWIAIGHRPVDADEPRRPQTLLDLSGLTWVEGDLFLGVHDAKDNPEKHDWPRVSLLRLPKSELQGVIWRRVKLEFPGPEGRSSDMESVCRIPGDKGFLFCESGQEGPDDRRIFHAVLHSGKLTIDSYTHWPVPITNVEATEVCQAGSHLVFMYAERADGRRSTQLRWAKLSLSPLKIGPFEEVTYQAVDPVGEGARPIVALDIDRDGLLYIVSAFDSGRDDGPYRSVVWRIGKVTTNAAGEPKVELGDAERLATLDGLKVESVTVRQLPDGGKQVYVGTDDEHYGGILRLLP
jgi:hypothetical protein